MQITVILQKILRKVLYLLTHAMLRIEFLIFYVMCLGNLLQNDSPAYYVAWTLLIAPLSDLLAQFVHEMGHFLWGGLAGFRLFDMGIPFVKIRKKKNGWVICENTDNRNYCSMKRKRGYASRGSYLLYYCGGFCANFLVTLVCILLWRSSFFVACGVGLYHFGTGIKNMIPNGRRRYNDGTIVKLLLSDKKTMAFISQQMDVQSKLLLGSSLADIPCIAEEIEANKRNDLVFFSELMKFYLDLEEDKYEECVQRIERMEKDVAAYSTDMQELYWCERLFLYSLVKHPEAEKIYHLYLSGKPVKTIDFYCSLYSYGILKQKKGIEMERLRLLLQNYFVRNGENAIVSLKAHLLRFNNLS